jgi:CBS domain containing-hemolysin-like protein
MWFTPALIILVLTLLTALYVAAEFAAVSVRRSRLRQLAEDGHWLARRLLPTIEDPHALDRYIAASQIGITLTSLILGAYGQAAIGPSLAPIVTQLTGLDAATSLSVTGGTILLFLTIFNVLLGELMPKSLALQFPTQVALYTVFPMQWSLWVYGGFIRFLNGGGWLLLQMLGIKQTGHRHIHSPDELELLIAESRDGGLLEPDEHKRLQRALRMRLRTAAQLMVPRERIHAVNVDTPFDELLPRLEASPYTRLPVYRGTLDHVIGRINTKQLALRQMTGTPPASIVELMRPIVTVPDSMPGDRLIATFRERRTHQAIVVDAQGRVTGLVTLDDVLTDLLDTKKSDAAAAALPPASGSDAGAGAGSGASSSKSDSDRRSESTRTAKG